MEPAAQPAVAKTEAVELPQLEDATNDDMLLAIRACGTLAMYGGFLRVALAGIYAERNRASELQGD